MATVTRAVTADDLAELLALARRASVAWNRDGQIMATPAAFRFKDGRYLIGVPPETLSEGAEVTVLIDEGPMYFDLRGVRIRGPVTVVETGRDDGLHWFAVKPRREVAWHYGSLRER